MNQQHSDRLVGSSTHCPKTINYGHLGSGDQVVRLVCTSHFGVIPRLFNSESPPSEQDPRSFFLPSIPLYCRRLRRFCPISWLQQTDSVTPRPTTGCYLAVPHICAGYPFPTPVRSKRGTARWPRLRPLKSARGPTLCKTEFGLSECSNAGRCYDSPDPYLPPPRIGLHPFHPGRVERRAQAGLVRHGEGSHLGHQGAGLATLERDP